MTKTAGTISTMKFVCDYCNLEITSSPIYTETKVFAGRKISDLLQIVSNFSLPTNFRIELCNVCASNLIIATSLIVKTQKLIDNSLKKMETIDQNKNEEEELNQLDVQLVDLKENGSPPYPNECKPIDLTNAVQLLPSNDKPKENQSLVQLFGASIASNVKERKSKEVEDLTSEHETKEVTTIDNSYVKDFGCRLCDFKGMEAESLKKHLKSVHQLQRPRIFFCNVCPKSFGLIKTLSTHLLTHGIINPQDTANSQEKMTKKKPTATKRLALVEEPKSKEVPSSSVPIVIQKMVDHANTPDCNVQDIEENEIENTLEDTEKKDKPIDQSNKKTSITDVGKFYESFDGINHEVMPLKKSKTASSKTNEDVVDCTQCGKTVSSLKSLQSHIQKKHNKIIKCPICLSVYACHLKYVTHFNKCDKGNGFPCGVRKCKKVFQNGDYLISHLKKKHVFR
ncbi:uncharacterized protein Dwil_GK15002 [Drosophila willistoni]|uniref:C2H2-type domain-containing protein n=1 Tax=Drosophila willistoni TaxID=7260 RepID=A0A0Q9X272_DROWI|nr:uncharacterized protein Dwil_GK15002 [Drosophila willistoni]